MVDIPAGPLTLTGEGIVVVDIPAGPLTLTGRGIEVVEIPPVITETIPDP